jgi:class 3 adenylate cyclase
MDVEWLDPLVGRERNRELERYVKQEAGLVPPHTRFFGSCPWIMRADIDFDIGCAHIGRLADLIYLTVSRHNSCRFCYGGARLFMRMAGMSEAEIERLEQDVETARLEPRVLRALDFARLVSRSNPAPGSAERKQLLELGCGEEEIDELALFADLVGFTALSESIEPDVLVRILNGYFERMSRAISEHRGHVSTFIGDGILALFGALQPNPWQGNDAVQAALAMRAELAAYNRELEAEQLPTLAIGIGLHRGSGVAGLVGSRELMQYAFVGRIVNLASRVQDLTRSFRVDILLTRAVKDTLDPRFELRELAPTAVRGIAGEVEIFAVDGIAGEH